MHTSTPNGRTVAIAAPTLSARSPPARNTGHGGGLDDAPAHRPVVHAPGAAQDPDRRVRLAGIEQQRVGMRGRGDRLRHGLLARDVNHLHQLDARQGRAQLRVDLVRDLVDELQGVGPAAARVRDDRLGVGLAGQEERGDRRRHPCRDRGDQRVVDRPRAARHGPDQAQRIGAVRDREARFVRRLGAADLDPGAVHVRSGGARSPLRPAGRRLTYWIVKPARPNASVSAACPILRHLERVGLLRILLGLDHHPARVADLGEHLGERAEVDRAVARHGEHALDHALEERPVLGLEAVEHARRGCPCSGRG